LTSTAVDVVAASRYQTVSAMAPAPDAAVGEQIPLDDTVSVLEMAM
jgi:hypothetical protein